MRFLFCGDVMPGGVLPYQGEYITEEVKSYLKSFDLRIGTLGLLLAPTFRMMRLK